MPKAVEITLDRARRIGYTWRDASDLSRRTGGLTMQGMLTRLAEMDPTAINLFLWIGLRNFDRGLTLEQTEGIVQKWIDEGNRPTDILTMILNALEDGGVIRIRKREDEPGSEGDGAAESPPLGPRRLGAS